MTIGGIALRRLAAGLIDDDSIIASGLPCMAPGL